MCKEMGWGWSQLQESPADFVQEILLRTQLREKWRSVRQELDRSKNG